MSPRRPAIIVASSLCLVAGVAGGALVPLAAASRNGVAPIPSDLAIGALVGLGVAAPVAIAAGLLVRTRPVQRVLAPLLFPALGVCVFLGPFANHALTLAGVGVSVALAVLAICFFMRPRTETAQDDAPRCPTCDGMVTEGDERCPHCAALLPDA